ncbi:class I SAM-dependent methyltransferase [Mucilaginibacter sp. McL0603]|uniref:class I SAM-dependent methyltransferase n=1 Tax=Mucilaginibacter sp. McL0603 TaxID=3415670 RepID=UPI003CF7B652
MIDNWLPKQVITNVEQWDNSLTKFYPDAKQWMDNPRTYLTRLTVDCNYLNAVKQLDWDKYLFENSTVLDIGCGGGWLTGYLSANKKISKLMAIDSSINYLETFLPVVVDQMGGDISKIRSVQGFFSPVLLESNSVDTIVISSALHHAEGISGVLQEYKRVLKPNGFLLILNETPAAHLKYLFSISRAFIGIFCSSLFKNYREHVKKISAGGFLYDPYLGDVDYPEWYWKKTIENAGFTLVDVHNTQLATVVNSKGRSLKHFICRK